MKSLLWMVGLIAVALCVAVFAQPMPPLPTLPPAIDLGGMSLAGLPFIGAAGLIVNQASLAALFTGYQAAFNKGLGVIKPQWDQIATLTQSSTKQEIYAWLGQFPQLREWLGDRSLKGMESFNYTIVNKKYEGTIEVPRDDIEDDTYGIFAPRFEEMGRAVNTFPDLLVFQLLMAGFTTLCYDGQFFFDVDHPVGAGVVSNFGGGGGTGWYLLDTTHALKPLIFQKRREFAMRAMVDLNDEKVFNNDTFRFGVDGRCNVGYGFWQMAYASKQALDANGYAAARAAIAGFQSNEGRPLGLIPNLLVVPPALEGAANALVGAQYNAAGASNPWYGTAKVLMTPYLS